MVPVAGLELYRRLRQLNNWTAAFLPNASAAADYPSQAGPTRLARLLRGGAERALQTPLGGQLEKWEMQRKIRKFSRRLGQNGHGQSGGETAFGPDWCKGHFDNHGRRIMETFSRHLEELAADGLAVQGEANGTARPWQRS
jgi:hypothetical protein